MTRSFARAASLLLGPALVVLLMGCAGPGAGQSPDESSSSSPSKAYGRAFVTEALRTYRFILDPDVTAPVQQTGRRLAQAVGLDPNTIHFFVVDEPQPNAFAIPGGYIFVFTGLLTKLGDEEELAGVLAHELGHVAHNHFFQNSKQIMALNLATLAALLLTKGHPAALAFPLGAEYNLQLAYSREHEAEADASAVGYLRDAGYDPAGLVRFFQTLLVYERFNPPLVPAYFTTHPGVAERLRVIETMVGEREPQAPEQTARAFDWGRLRASLGTVPEGPSATGREQYLHAVDWLKQNRVDAAIEAYRLLLAQEPHHARARADLSLALLKNQMRTEARDEALRSLADDPAQALPSVVLGLLAQDASRHGEAIEHFQEAAARAPIDHTIHLRLAQSFAALGDEAREAYHLGRYFRLGLEPARAVLQYERFRADPRADPELRREVDRDLAEIRREGV
ncbi:MAG: M48 family metalloprotease [Nitrospirae bacterium]|nr:M48 family metalloprotease [Nitrospirota bacterium]